MRKNLIILLDGTEISSGIRSCTYTESVNSGTELTLGSVCCACLELSVLTPAGGLTIGQGAEIAYYQVDDAGARTLIGQFTCEKPTRSTAGTYKVTAYDQISWTDRDLSPWLRGLTGWPYSLYAFAGMVCAQCGLELANTSLPNGSYQIQQFYADGITGRRLLQWIGEASAQFCRATPEGKIQFGWYQQREGLAIGPGSYYWESLSYEDYQVAAIDRVQIKQGEGDVGIIHPADAGGGSNTYIIDSNLLLTTGSDTALRPIAQAIYNAIHAIRYTPCKVAIMASLGVRAGDIAPVTDANGNTITTYVMTRTTSGQRDTLESTGSARRDSVTAAHSNTLQNLHGRILKILATIDGLTIENQDLAGQVTGLSLALGELRTYVQTTGEETDETIQRLQSLIEQTATRLEITFSQTSERIDGVGNDLADAVAEISTYIRASSDGVEIGKSDSPYAARLTNDRLEFTENGTVVAYISNNKMYVTSVEATEYARLCCFEFFQRSSGAGVCRYRRIT
jgi:hypothetical protein|nr:MAG TPA: tail protein [Siphoviridae sp. ctKRf14]